MYCQSTETSSSSPTLFIRQIFLCWSLFFFFSSRRRHTRFDCDWSSDVCSSDLFQNFLHRRGIVILISDFYEEPEKIVRSSAPLRFHGNEMVLLHILDPQEIRPEQIGRASCRERV